MSVVVVTSSSLSSSRVNHKRRDLLSERHGHDLAVAIRHGATEGLGKKPLDIGGCIRSISRDFGDDCVCEAAGVCLDYFNLDNVPSLHEVVVV